MVCGIHMRCGQTGKEGFSRCTFVEVDMWPGVWIWRRGRTGDLNHWLTQQVCSQWKSTGVGVGWVWGKEGWGRSLWPIGNEVREEKEITECFLLHNWGWDQEFFLEEQVWICHLSTSFRRSDPWTNRGCLPGIEAWTKQGIGEGGFKGRSLWYTVVKIGSVKAATSVVLGKRLGLGRKIILMLFDV